MANDALLAEIEKEIYEKARELEKGIEPDQSPPDKEQE